MSNTVRIATRRSKLALWQANKVGEMLGVDYELIEVTTTGDAKIDVSIAEIGGTGAFAKEIQLAVLEGSADIAVHSAKDLPAITPEGLDLASFPLRGDVRDALVGSTLDSLPQGAVVGTGSQRRKAQLLNLRPDLKFEDLRGNINSRLEKSKNFDAIVVAYTALQRLNEEDKVSDVLSVETMLPQVAQGALGLEVRSGDSTSLELVQKINNDDIYKCVKAERSFLETLGGGCTIPCAAYAVIENGLIYLRALLSSEDGSEVIRSEERMSDPYELGKKVADDILNTQNGLKLMEELKS